MLYRGSEIMREVGWVIFDEIHYMRDKGAYKFETYVLKILYQKNPNLRSRRGMGRDDNFTPGRG